MKKTARCTAFFHYPVELVWRAIGFGSEQQTVDPLDEDEYMNKEPEKGTVFTRSLEVKTNEVFAFQMKTAFFFADWRVELYKTGECETRAVISETVTYRSVKDFLLCSLMMPVRREVKSFAKDLGDKLEKQSKK